MIAADKGSGNSLDVVRAVGVKIRAGEKPGVDRIICSYEAVGLRHKEFCLSRGHCFALLELKDKVDHLLHPVSPLCPSCPAGIEKRAIPGQANLGMKQSGQAGAEGWGVQHGLGSQCGQHTGHDGSISAQAEAP